MLLCGAHTVGFYVWKFSATRFIVICPNFDLCVVLDNIVVSVFVLFYLSLANTKIRNKNQKNSD